MAYRRYTGDGCKKTCHHFKSMGKMGFHSHNTKTILFFKGHIKVYIDKIGLLKAQCVQFQVALSLNWTWTHLCAMLINSVLSNVINKTSF